MVNTEVLNKLAQIEEQAGHALAEFPKGLTKERLQMILALARQLRAGLQVQATGTVVTRSPRIKTIRKLAGPSGESRK